MDKCQVRREIFAIRWLVEICQYWIVIQNAINVRDSLKKMAMKDFKRQRNLVTGMKRTNKKMFFSKLVESKSYTKSTWKAINTLSNNTSPSPPQKKIVPQLEFLPMNLTLPLHTLRAEPLYCWIPLTIPLKQTKVIPIHKSGAVA